MSNLTYVSGKLRQQIESILGDPAASYAVKETLRAWLERDAVDAMRDAQLLRDVLKAVEYDVRLGAWA